MSELASDKLNIYLKQALDNSLCSQVWLGYGNILFLGLGDKVISSPHSDHPLPQYELQTYFSDWFVEQRLPVSNHLRFAEDEVASVLVGTHIISWNLSNDFLSLAICFENDIELHIDAWSVSELDAEQRSSDAWVLTLPDKSSIAVSCSGVITFESIEKSSSIHV